MRVMLYTLCLVASLSACSKKSKPPATGIAGTWIWTEKKKDPYNGTGQDIWQPAGRFAYLEFGEGKIYKDSRDAQYNRYVYSQDTIKLYSTDNADTLRLTVLELNATTLRYHFPIGREGTDGEAFSRKTPRD
jgi:hypothetical protein